jgi:hypothetical protein
MRAKVNIHAAFDDYHRAVFGRDRTDVAEDITQECFLALMYGSETRRGATVWFCYPGQGRYILSPVPHEGFILGSKGAWNLYVLHAPSYAPKENRQVRFATDRLENLLPKR